jgi:hypothetical protein
MPRGGGSQRREFLEIFSHFSAPDSESFCIERAHFAHCERHTALSDRAALSRVDFYAVRAFFAGTGVAEDGLMHRGLSGLLGLVVALGAHTAHAESSEVPAHRAAVGDTRFALGPGFFSGPTLSGADLSGLVAARYEWLEAGLLLQAGSALIGGSDLLLGGGVGPVYRSDNGLRLELLGVVASHSYRGVGCDLLCNGGGADGSSPWLGARLGASYLFGPGRSSHFELGANATLGADTRNHQVHYSTTESDWLDSGTDYTWEGTTTLGGTRAAFEIVLGRTFDFGG